MSTYGWPDDGLDRTDRILMALLALIVPVLWTVLVVLFGGPTDG